MNTDFKPGDLVFELTAKGKVLLSKLGHMPLSNDCVSTESSYYTSQGINEQLKASRLFHATPENHQALVMLYGEDTVPELPLRGSELTKKLLQKQKYVMCLVSGISDDAARSNDPPRAYAVSGIIMDYFDLSDGSVSDYAVPIDVDGNEITEYK